MKSAAISIPGRAHDAYSGHVGSGSQEHQRAVSASPSRTSLDSNPVVWRAASQARSASAGCVKQAQPEQASAAVPYPNIPQSLVPGLVRAPTLAEMEFEQRPIERLDEAALHAFSGEFAGRLTAMLTEIGACHQAFEGSSKNTVLCANAGYGLYRLGMEVGELCRRWLRGFHADQDMTPSLASLSAAARGIAQMGHQNWLPALHALGGVVMQQPRFRDAIQYLGKCAEAMAAHYMGEVGHLPNADQFGQKIEKGISQMQGIDRKLDAAPDSPVLLEKQREICLGLVEAGNRWSARSGEFAAPEKASTARDLLKGAGAALLREDARAALHEFGRAVRMDPGFEMALRGLIRTAQTRADAAQAALDKINQNLRQAVWLADYKLRMQQHYAWIDEWSEAARSPEVRGAGSSWLLNRGGR